MANSVSLRMLTLVTQAALVDALDECALTMTVPDDRREASTETEERAPKEIGKIRKRHVMENYAFKDVLLEKSLAPELPVMDPWYRKSLGMQENDFAEILSLIRSRIERRNTLMRSAVTPEVRLAIALKYLTTGISFRDLASEFKIGERTASYIVIGVCEALHEALKSKLQFPEKENDWVVVATEFGDKRNFPNCLGAIGSHHFLLRKPNKRDRGKKYAYVVAVADAKLRFVHVDVDQFSKGRGNDMWQKCQLNESLENGALRIPKSSVLQGTCLEAPFIFLGDDAFPLTKHFMRPYSGQTMTEQNQAFNQRFSRARRCIDNTFGILGTKFCVFHTYKLMVLDIANIRHIILAACMLHNFLLERHPLTYVSPDLIDREDAASGTFVPGSWRNSDFAEHMMNVKLSYSRNPSREALSVRKVYRDYFCSESGSIPSDLEADQANSEQT